MFKKITQFIKYHNAMAIAVSLILTLSLSAMASEDIRDTIIGEKIETVKVIDNSQLLAADLDNFNFKMTITNVVQDNQNYYIDYQFKTLAIKDNVWQSALKNKRLTVSKAFLAGSDLGLYVQEELGEVADYELSYLKEVQTIQKRKGKTEITKTTEYTGLIGLVLNVKNKIFPGYEPVIKPSVIEIAQVSEPIIELIEQPLTEQLPDEQTATSPASTEEQFVVTNPEVLGDPLAPPDTIVNSHPLKTTTSLEAVFSFHATKENCQFTCKIDAEFWQGCQSPITYTDLFIGNHQFHVQSIDSANQEDPMPAMFEWQIIETQTTSSSADSTNSSQANQTATSTNGTATSTEECQLQSFYFDSDNDGYGNPANATTTCEQPANYIINNTDCDDTNPNINPLVTEICDSIDNNCDGNIDEDCDCGIIFCDANLKLTGECQNACIDGSCQVCSPTCICVDGFYDCDSDGTCETQGECPAVEKAATSTEETIVSENQTATSTNGT